MASLTAFDAFATRLADWTTTPVVFENEFYELPDEPAAFIYVEVFGDAYDQETTGAPGENMWQENGVTYLHVMVPSGRGSRLGRDYANQLLYLFREQPISTLFMPEMSIGAGDPGRDFPNYWAMTTTVFWRRWDITTLP
jgi:hypothetical protein